MNLQKDSAGHLYAVVENIRITCIPAADRAEGKDWAESDVIRVQAYRNINVDESLHRGAEFPIQSPEIFDQIVTAMRQVYAAGRSAV